MAIYCRVSTDDQDNDRQERDLKEYAERAYFEVVAVFRETLSGLRKAKGRQPVERKRAMELAQRRGIDAVLVTEMTRWARKRAEICALCFLDGLALVAILGVDAKRAEISAPCVAVMSGKQSVDRKAVANG